MQVPAEHGIDTVLPRVTGTRIFQFKRFSVRRFLGEKGARSSRVAEVEAVAGAGAGDEQDASFALEIEGMGDRVLGGRGDGLQGRNAPV